MCQVRRSSEKGLQRTGNLSLQGRCKLLQAQRTLAELQELQERAPSTTHSTPASLNVRFQPAEVAAGLATPRYSPA
jgi:hypothetical protein